MSASDAYSPWVHGLAQGFLFKPFTQTVLRAKVQALLQDDGSSTRKDDSKIASWDSPMVLLHHLRNSVGSVLQIFPVFAKKTDEDFRAKFIALAQRSVESSMSFIEEYVELLSPIELKLEDIQVNSWLNSVVASHPISTTPATKVLWQIDTGSIPPTECDPALFKRVIDAVLTNAVEAMPAGGTLTVGAYGDIQRQWTYILFQDSGEGMEEYIAEQAFEPFFTMKKNKRGIGLSWAQKIARAHGGDIEFRSRPAPGAAFW